MKEQTMNDMSPTENRTLRPVPSRRQVLGSMLALLGAAPLTSGVLDAAFAKPAYGAFKPTILNDIQLRRYRRYVDLLIPETDTPGAIAAGVPEYIDYLLVHWASKDKVDQVLGAIDALPDLTGADGGETLTAYDSTALGEYFDRDYETLKSLSLMAYYTSEQAAEGEVQIDLIPGGFWGCLDISEIEKTGS